MLEYIRGTIVEIQADRIVVETAGIGFEVFATKELINKVKPSSEATVYVYLHISEDGLKFFGFANKLEKSIFTDLISVPDIGPSKAIKILSSLSPDILIDCILNERTDALSEIPGIGFKTAKKLVTFLKDKVIKYKELQPVATYNNIYTDLKKALKQLGYKESEINKAIEKMSKEKFEGSIEEAIKECINALTQ